MATPKQLVTKIAELTGIPEGTVILHDRNLMTAGLRSEGVRGRGTSSVTFEDATNLLIAVAAGRAVRDSARTVLAYKDLPCDSEIDFGDERRGSTFSDALAALMEAMAANPSGWRAGYDEDGYANVFLYGPEPTAKIEIRNGKERHVFLYEPNYRQGEARKVGDLQFISKFTQVTLGHVGVLVSGK